MKRLFLAAASAVACMLMCACAPVLAAGGPAVGLPTAAAALQAVGLTANAYCALAPEGRAEIRRQLGLRARIIPCPGDPPFDPIGAALEGAAAAAGDTRPASGGGGGGDPPTR